MNYRKQLVETIDERLEHHLTAEVRAAFLQVPREAFVAQYYQQQGRTLTWDLVQQPTLAEIYQDHALVTRLDARNLPSSSSSQPSIMAAQLDALALARGQRVLEISAGTGYNAALMAMVVGDTGEVVTIDIAEDLVQQVQARVQGLGIEHIRAFTANGYLGTFWREVARLGGYLARRRDGPPGWQTIWKGWLSLQTLLEGAQLALHLRF